MIGRGISILTLCFLWCVVLATPSADAGVLAFEFIHEGFSEDAFVSGTFYGEDLNGDGFLSFQTDFGAPFDEIINLNFNFSGNSLLPAISFDLSGPASFAALVYDFNGGPLLGDDTDVIFGLDELMLVADDFNDPTFVYGTGTDAVGEFPLGIAVVVDGELQIADFTTEIAMVTPTDIVPEPASFAIWGLILTGGAARPRQRRSSDT